MRAKITAEQHQEILDMRRAGVTLAAIGKQFGYSTYWAWKICSKAGVKRHHLIHQPSPRLQLTLKRDPEIRALRAEGYTLRCIGEAYGLSSWRVGQIVAGVNNR